ncbi:MAG: FAD-binding protein [Pseudomonadota bacterium]
MSVLIYAEHDGSQIAGGTLSAVTAATALDSDIHLLVVGSGAEAAANAGAQVAGITKVLYGDSPDYENPLAEDVAAVLVDLAGNYDVVMAAHTTVGKNILPRAGALLDIQPISDIMGVESADTFVRPIYAGNAIATVKTSDAKKVLTVRATAFDAAPTSGGSGSVENISLPGSGDLSTFVGQELTKSERPELTAASIIISGGRGMQNGENFSMLDTIADKLGAAVGASRAAVDAGFVPNDYQVGQTGKIVAPELYIAVGISGAIQHLAGMKDSKVIVAINKDEEAPIFQVADYGLVADLFAALPELEAELNK